MFFSLYTLNLIPINYHVQRLRSCEFNINLLLLLLLLYFYIIINNFNINDNNNRKIISNRISLKMYCMYCMYCVYCMYRMYCVYCMYCVYRMYCNINRMYCVYCMYHVYCMYCVLYTVYMYCTSYSLSIAIDHSVHIKVQTYYMYSKCIASWHAHIASSYAHTIFGSPYMDNCVQTEMFMNIAFSSHFVIQVM